jgi:hypothetical protein
MRRSFGGCRASGEPYLRFVGIFVYAAATFGLRSAEIHQPIHSHVLVGEGLLKCWFGH